MTKAVKDLSADLSHVTVPPTYSAGHTAMLQALQRLLDALKLRDTSIVTKNSAGLAKSYALLGRVDLAGAAAQYPSGSGISVTNS